MPFCVWEEYLCGNQVRIYAISTFSTIVSAAWVLGCGLVSREGKHEAAAVPLHRSYESTSINIEPSFSILATADQKQKRFPKRPWTFMTFNLQESLQPSQLRVSLTNVRSPNSLTRLFFSYFSADSYPSLYLSPLIRVMRRFQSVESPTHSFPTASKNEDRSSPVLEGEEPYFLRCDMGVRNMESSSKYAWNSYSITECFH